MSYFTATDYSEETLIHIGIKISLNIYLGLLSLKQGGCGYVKKPVYLLDSSEPRPSNAYTLRVLLNFPMELQNTHAC